MYWKIASPKYPLALNTVKNIKPTKFGFNIFYIVISFGFFFYFQNAIMVILCDVTDITIALFSK